MRKGDTFTIFHLGDATGGRCGADCTGVDGHAASPAWNETFPPRQTEKKQYVHESRAGPDGPWTPVEGGA